MDENIYEVIDRLGDLLVQSAVEDEEYLVRFTIAVILKLAAYFGLTLEMATKLAKRYIKELDVNE